MLPNTGAFANAQPRQFREVNSLLNSSVTAG